jgi:Phage Terminase
MNVRVTPKTMLQVFDTAFAPWYAEQDGDFSQWRAFVAAMTAAPMSPDEFALYQRCTGRTRAPERPFTEAWAIVGRRGGKSRVAAGLAVYCACHVRWPRVSGETLQVLVLAVSKDQAARTLKYVEALMRTRKALRELIVRVEPECIVLRTGIEIVVAANNYRSVRGSTVVAAIFEEVGHWRDENSANPDREIYRAIRPAMLTVPGALLVGISSPHAKAGLLYEKWRDCWGKDESRVLVWQAATEVMNPGVDRDELAGLIAEDPVAGAAEYGAQFRDDVTGYLLREVVESLVSTGCSERPPVPNVAYRAFVDPSGGSGSDSMTLAIAHREPDANVLDAVREIRPPYNTADAVAEFARVLKSFRCARVTGDHFGGEWPAERFADHQITYELSKRTKQMIYVDAIAHVNSRRVRLLDVPRLIGQVCALERRAVPGGREKIDHPRYGHDDLANAALGALVLCGSASRYTDALMNNVSGPPRPHPRGDGAPVPALSWEQQIALYASMGGR